MGGEVEVAGGRCTPEEDGEKDDGRRVLSEVIEEDAPLTPCAFLNRPVHALSKSPLTPRRRPHVKGGRKLDAKESRTGRAWDVLSRSFGVRSRR